MQTIYSAGPEVFLDPDLVGQIFEAKRKLSLKYGFETVTPFDADLTDIDNTFGTGIRIAQANEELIDKANFVIANLTPFRSQNADPGTVFEVGYARAKGKKVYGYTSGEPKHVIRIAQGLFCGHTTKDDHGFLRERFTQTHIDDFGMTENAMIDGAIYSSGGCIHHALCHNRADIREQLKDVSGYEMCLKSLRESEDLKHA